MVSDTVKVGDRFSFGGVVWTVTDVDRIAAELRSPTGSTLVETVSYLLRNPEWRVS